MTKELSKCCQAPTKVDSAHEGTCCCVCTKCGMACDPMNEEDIWFQKQLAAERNKVIEEVLAMLPEEATERNSAKVSPNHIFTYDQCLAWNEYRKYTIRNITNLRSKQ